MKQDELRRLIRYVLVENALPTEISEETMIALGEFIGANEPLNLQRHMYAFKPYVKVYTNLYRVWMQYDSDVSLEELEIEAKRREYLSSTSSASAITRMLDHLGSNDDFAITKFDGEGFDPFDVLNDGLKLHPHHPEAAYLRSTLKQNAHQKEVIVLRILSHQQKINSI